MELRAIIFLMASNLAQAGESVICNYSGNQQEMNACALQDFEKADSALNAEYKNAMTLLSEAQKENLLQSQRVWLQNRDPQCRAEANEEAEGDSMWQMLFNSCRAKLTEARTSEIRNSRK